jgi:ribosome biogenesis GTPase A
VNRTELERAVQWYPGHMVRTMRRIREYLELIDLVVEVIDARAPRSGANPTLGDLIGSRPRIVVLNRDDLADPATTAAWVREFGAAGQHTMALEGRQQQRVSRLRSTLSAMARERTGVSRAMVVGLPNSGKSAVVNGLLKRGAAKTEDRAGVTRQLRWFRLSPSVELMDTPGVLVPKIATPAAQWKLALIGAVPRERYDPQEICRCFHDWLLQRTAGGTTVPDLDRFAATRGFVRHGGEVDYHNAAQSYIRAFNEGTFGRISLESPNDDDNASST